jgi:hypothetical protein
MATTERTYYNQLAALESVYINPLRSQPDVLRLKCSDVLFSNIMSIKAVTEGLLSALEQRADDRELGRILCDFCPMLQMYHDYAKYNHEANNLLAKLLAPETSRFKTFVDEAANAPEAKGLKLTSFLIAPIQVNIIHIIILLNVRQMFSLITHRKYTNTHAHHLHTHMHTHMHPQRVPRYLLLLKEIMLNTTSNHPDSGNLIKAYTLLEAQGSKINESVRAPLEGWLSKRGSRNKTWKKRYFVLKDGVMSSFKTQEERQANGEPNGQFVVKSSRVVLFSRREKELHAEENETEGHAGSTFGVTPHMTEVAEQRRQYVLECETEVERKMWVESLLGHGAVSDGEVHETITHPDALREGMLAVPGVLGNKHRYVLLLPRILQVLVFFCFFFQHRTTCGTLTPWFMLAGVQVAAYEPRSCAETHSAADTKFKNRRNGRHFQYSERRLWVSGSTMCVHVRV